MEANEWLLTAERAAIHRPTKTAIVADLHLGVDDARLSGGETIPRGRDPTLERLARLKLYHGAQRLIVAGDLIEDGRGNAAMLAWRDGLVAVGLELTAVVPGNHDRHLARGDLPVFPDGVALGRWRIVHGDEALPVGPVVHGHFHPWMEWDAVRSAPCFVHGADRLVLPAFSDDSAGGMNVIGKRAWARYRCAVIVGDQVLDFGRIDTLTQKHRARHMR
jgi:metallophosphoesterase superfamily enzyme